MSRVYVRGRSALIAALVANAWGVTLREIGVLPPLRPQRARYPYRGRRRRRGRA